MEHLIDKYMYLMDANLSEANLSEANLMEADLKNANLERVKVYCTNFEGSQGVDRSWAQKSWSPCN